MIKNIVISKIGSATPAVEPVSQPSPPRPTNPYEHWIEAERDAFYAGLRSLKDACGSNKNTQVTMLAHACIDAGINTPGWIITVLAPLGLDRQHVGSVITKGIGRWCRKDKQGALTLIPGAMD